MEKSFQLLHFRIQSRCACFSIKFYLKALGLCMEATQDSECLENSYNHGGAQRSKRLGGVKLLEFPLSSTFSSLRGQPEFQKNPEN